MPKGIPREWEDDSSVAEQLLGRGDDKRSTKTYIENGPLAMMMGFVRGLPTLVLDTARHLEAEHTGEDLGSITNEILLERYPEGGEVIEIHQQIVGHKGSQDGFLVDRTTRFSEKEEMTSKKEHRESSGGGTDRWG